MAKILHERFTITNGIMTTIHSYTNDQEILDLPHKDLRRGRAAALSMIPTSTGAAAAVGLVLPELKGKFDGISVRVPTPNVSLVDLTFRTERATSADEITMASAYGVGREFICVLVQVGLSCARGPAWGQVSFGARAWICSA